VSVWGPIPCLPVIPISVAFVLGVRTKNPLNGGIGNTKLALIIRSNERAKQKKIAFESTRAHLLRAHVSPADLVPCIVTLTRVSAGKMDTDGLAASQKGVRDGIAHALGIDDGSVFVEWRYAQMKGPQKQHAVHVRIERKVP
jgi:hypothetical protein